MKIELENNIFKTQVVATMLIFLIITPWFNKDSMVIPKVIILCLLASFLIPLIIQKLRYLAKTKILKIFLLTIALIIVQMILVIIMSDSPIQQQIFGKMGRGLGFITSLAVLILIVGSAIFANRGNLLFFLRLSIITFTASSLYAIFQSYGLDFVKWETKTNSIFGTLGNPNFQSSAAAIIVIPCILLSGKHLRFILLPISLVLINVFVILKTASVQGVVSLIIGLGILAIIYFWYRSPISFVASLIIFAIGMIFSVLAMLNIGPLRSLVIGSFTFYKASIESRGDFWRAAIDMANEHPVFGVGVDSFGDYYTLFRDSTAANRPNAEFTDNAHNYFLEYASTGGYLLATLHIFLAMITLYSFIKLIKNSQKFDRKIVSLFIMWIIFQAQSIISPASISLLVINAMSSGLAIGLSVVKGPENLGNNQKSQILKDSSLIPSGFFVLIATIIMIPYFNSDRAFLNALNSGNANLLVESTQMFPQSTQKYTIASRLLLESKVYDQSLKVAKLAIQFNPKNISPWAQIILNPLTTFEEKSKAQSELINLDPNNEYLKNLVIERN